MDKVILVIEAKCGCGRGSLVRGEGRIYCGSCGGELYEEDWRDIKLGVSGLGDGGWGVRGASENGMRYVMVMERAEGEPVEVEVTAERIQVGSPPKKKRGSR